MKSKGGFLIMKGWISLLSGLILGITISYFVLDLVTNSFLIVLGVSILIYVIWTFIEKKSKG